MPPGQSDEVMVGDLIRTTHQVRAQDPVFTTEIIRNKMMACVCQKSSQDAEGLIRRHAVAEKRMGGNPRKTKLR